MSFDLAFLFLILCSVASVIFFLSKNEEMPLFLCFYTGMVLMRIYMLETGQSDWVSFDYGIHFVFNMEEAYEVGKLIILGTIILSISFIIFFKSAPAVKRDSSDYLKQFLAQKKTMIIVLFTLFYLFQVAFGNTLSVGYATNLTLANSAFIILIFLLFYKSDTTKGQKVIFSIFAIILAYSTYSSENRFQFLGWAIPIFFLFMQGKKPIKKLIPAVIGLVVIMVFFSIARTLRSDEVRQANAAEKYEHGVERLMEFEDINFIDGFIMLKQVYPDYLDYHYGLDHLSILMRPIPRTLWPGKPLASWHQKYAAKYNYGENFEAGFSPTLYGVFYGEGGVIAIVIFSALWGWMIARVNFAANRFEYDLAAILKGILIAGLIPVLRSGDLPGDIAVVGMSYWPIFVFLYLYNKYTKKEKLKEMHMELAVQTGASGKI